jgi:hypothetical protein
MKASGMRRKVVRAGATAAGVLQVVKSGASLLLSHASALREEMSTSAPCAARMTSGIECQTYIQAKATRLWPLSRRADGDEELREEVARALEGKQLSRRLADTHRPFKRIETASYFPVDLR